jgi:hypothetical protein
MFLAYSQICSRLIVLTSIVAGILFSASSALAQSAFGGVGGDSPSSDTSRTPFKIKLRGFINTEPEEGSRVLKLGIADYRETYQFELVKVESVNDPQISEYAILQQVGKFDVDFNLVGPKDLLSKIGQAEPGTPFIIVGFLQQRNRKLQLQSVDIVGIGD